MMLSQAIDWAQLDAAFGSGAKFNSTTTIGAIVNAVIPLVFTLAGFALLLYLIFAGYQYMTSAGDPKKTAAAQSAITSALTGFIIIFGSYWIVRIVGVVLGLSKITSVFGGV